MIDLEEAARQSGVIPPERVASLIAALRRVPDFSWLLSEPHPAIQRLQADLLGDFPVAVIAPDGAVRCKRFVVLILNNTCDLQPNRSRFITVAPVLDFQEFARAEIAKRGEAGARSYLHDIRSNGVFELLWLPPFHTFREGGVVFLDRLGSAAINLYEESLANKARLATFSQNGFYYFLIKITAHMARAESVEVQRIHTN